MRPLRQFDSHGWAQMRPQIDASGLGARAMRYPRAVSHSATARTYPPAFVRTGQPVRHGIRLRKYLKSGTTAVYERVDIGRSGPSAREDEVDRCGLGGIHRDRPV